MATQSEVAAHLGIGQSAVAKLVDMGIFPRTPRRGLDLDQCRVAYLGRLREEAAGRAAQGDGEDLDLVTERARLAKEQADRISMENAITRRKVVCSTDVVKILSPLLANLRTRLLAMPSECAVSLANVSSAASAEAIVRRVVIEALNDLSSGTTAIAEHCDAAPGALADVAFADASPAPTRAKAASARAKGTTKPKHKATQANPPRKGRKS